MINQVLLLALASAALSSPHTARLSARQNQDFGDNDQNGLVDGNCADNIIIFARGTTELGNVGNIAGPPFFEAMAEAVGAENLVVQGIDYPADIPGFLAGGDADGSQLMADLTTQALSDCPGASVVMSGYSQGGQLVHNAADILGAEAMAGVAGAVIFGDPSMFFFLFFFLIFFLFFPPSSFSRTNQLYLY